MKSRHSLAFAIATTLAVPLILAGCRSRQAEAPGAESAATTALVPAALQTEPTASGQPSVTR